MRLGLAIVVGLCSTVAAWGADVERYGRWEQSFTAAAETDPDVEFSLDLTTPGGDVRRIDGFWDGGRRWLARYQPDQLGTWKYVAHSPAKSLDGQTGEFTCSAAAGTSRFAQHGPVVVAASKRSLAHADGTPFFWLGDTVWNGPLLATPQDWQTFLEKRAAQKFTVIQFNLLAPWRTAPTDRNGKTAWTGDKNVRIDPEFYQQLDAKFDAINAAGLLAAPVLAWAVNGEEPGLKLPEADVLKLARYQVARYQAHHVAFVLAGDNSHKGEAGERFQRIGTKLFGARSDVLVTSHPNGMNWPWESWKDSTWLDFLMYQSGHGDDDRTLAWMTSGPPAMHWQDEPLRPIINAEPPYEDHIAYQSRRPHSAYNVRRAVYWSLLAAPPAGVTYGAHGIWSWETKSGSVPRAHANSGAAKAWREAVDLPGGQQMTHVATLFESLPWPELEPHADWLAQQPGTQSPAQFISCAATRDGQTAVAYLPKGGEVQFAAGKLKSKVKATWFDPRTGARSAAVAKDQGVYSAPDTNDWVLILE